MATKEDNYTPKNILLTGGAGAFCRLLLMLGSKPHLLSPIFTTRYFCSNTFEYFLYVLLTPFLALFRFHCFSCRNFVV